MDAKLLKNMVDYIELTDSVICGLKETKPSFSGEALEKAASALEAAELIKAAEKDELVSMFQDKPDKALESIVKMASRLAKVPYGYSLGSPAGPARKARAERESDRVLNERLGLA